jgi:hypothetical protein
METEKNKSGNTKLKGLLTMLLMVVFLVFTIFPASAHCDSYDGPVIKDALEALKTNDVDLVLKWVYEDQEQEVISLFNKTYHLKKADSEVYEIVEKHFLETLVRLHRETEGAPYTGLKPKGSMTPIISMADASIENGSLEGLNSALLAHIERVVKEKYQKVMELNNIKNDSVVKGREYVAAYVDYTHTLEAIHAPLEHGVSHESPVHAH